MILQLVGHTHRYHMEHVVRIFYPHHSIEVITQAPKKKTLPYLTAGIFPENNDQWRLTATVEFPDFVEEKTTTLPGDAPPAQQRRVLGGLLFSLLQERSKKTPPWGSLMGVRPVRLLRNLMERGEKTLEEAGQELAQEYYVTPEKVCLASQVMEQQKEVLEKNTQRSFSLYISIPFCPSRCLYCSFVSHKIDRAAKLIPEYVDALCHEIQATACVAKTLGLSLSTVYIGGGTPTILTPEQLELLLSTVADSFDMANLLEYTVEAGRPDTITKEKLEVLSRYGVNRLSINPQTMDNQVLATIGREHTAEETKTAYAMAKSLNFPIINMDLIAGLPGETMDGFLTGLEEVMALAPENITVHTLTIKRSSNLWARGEFDTVAASLPRTLEQAQQRLCAQGYRPYYLYRQKGTIENLENVGYTRPGFSNHYNILSMEEVHTILAVGAGGVSKLYAGPRTLQRIFNHKYPYEYLDDFHGILESKSSIRSFYERNY